MKKNVPSPRIVCDTNVWINLASNPRLLNFVISNELRLIPTQISILEIIANGKTFKENNNRDIIFTYLNKYMPEVRALPPFPHMNHICNLPNKLDIDVETKRLKDLIHKLHLRHEIQNKKDTYASFTRDFQIFEELRNEFNRALEEIKKDDNQKKSSFEDFKTQTSESFKNLFASGMAHNSISKFDLNSISFNYFELAMTTMAYFDWQKITGPPKSTSGYKTNDFNDLFNLLYVAPDELYWSFERKTKSNFKKAIDESGMSHYLFDPEEKLFGLLA